MEKKKLTSANGRLIADNQNTQTAGQRGPIMMQDPWFLEKLAHFDREVIPERRMHAKGSGAYGTFTVTHDITKYTRAAIFSEVGKKTECFVRFSTVAGERGAADAERDIRGFAMKFYTEEGNWDLVGNNTPVFFLRDPLKFPDLNHAVKRDPRTNMRSPNNNWDFWTLLPEALHQVTITMSPRGIPYSYRHMHGFGTYCYYRRHAPYEASVPHQAPVPPAVYTAYSAAAYEGNSLPWKASGPVGEYTYSNHFHNDYMRDIHMPRSSGNWQSAAYTDGYCSQWKNLSYTDHRPQVSEYFVSWNS